MATKKKFDAFDDFTLNNIGVAFDDNGVITHRKKGRIVNKVSR